MALTKDFELHQEIEEAISKVLRERKRPYSMIEVSAVLIDMASDMMWTLVGEDL